ncbi:DUF6268 family outer membrane beta-barrel protein [Botrimarina sp.]|uniref:DUF6268 family outer membrane beta-barrel protein n=1 Tax=Botrimarina sp. TaxID=2795802 RepID=UPI0032EC3572
MATGTYFRGWAIAAILIAAGAAPAQPRRAYGVVGRMPPALEGEAEWLVNVPNVEGVRLAQSTEAVSRPDTNVGADPVLRTPPERGLLQSIDLLADWAPRLEDDSVGRSTFSASVGLGVPPHLLGIPLLLTPRAAIHLVDGPADADAPPRLYDLDLSVGTFKQLGPRWSARGSVTTGVYGDDYSLGESDALRVSGFGIALWDAAPGWQWVIGAAYLNRDDIAVVPAIGVIHDRGDYRYEITAPRGRVVRRLPQSPYGEQRALYFAAELGGGAWAVRRADGQTDTLNLSRWGVLLGYESGPAAGGSPSAAGAWKRRYEIGYLFGRELEFADTEEEFSLDDTLIVRGGWSY